MIMAVSHFEQKFKRKDEARVMLNYYLQEKIMRRVERTLYVVLYSACALQLAVAGIFSFAPHRMSVSATDCPLKFGIQVASA